MTRFAALSYPKIATYHKFEWSISVACVPMNLLGLKENVHLGMVYRFRRIKSVSISCA